MPIKSSHAPLIVWCAEENEAAPVLQALEEKYSLVRLASLPEAGDENPGLLIHLSPSKALCRTMARGTPPEEALKVWIEQTRTLLEVNRRDRRGVRVLDGSNAFSHPAAFRNYFGLPEGRGPEAQRRNSQDDLFLLTLAQRLLSESPEARRLAAELEAVSINFSGAAPIDPASPEAVFRAYQAHCDAEEELEVLRLRIDEKERCLQAAEALIRKAETDRAALTGETVRLRASRDRLSAEVERVYHSRSYRVTGPLRRLRAVLSRRGPA